MEQLFIFSFLTVFSTEFAVSYHYYLIKHNVTWSEAQAYCRANHTDLATIETAADLRLLQTEAQRFDSAAWIGLYNDLSNGWRWSFGNEPLGPMRQFPSGVPDNFKGNEDCVYTANLGWWDIPCDTVIPFVCFNDVPDNYIYYFAEMNWTDAQSYCRLYHTDLASSKSTAEQFALKKLTSGWTWFGLFKDRWSWSDQTKFFLSSWMPPSQMDRDCVYVNKTQVSGALCTDQKSFFCYGVTTGWIQIVKIKFESNQNLNDPAVNTVIQEK